MFLVFRTPSVTLENLVFMDCNGTSSVIVLTPRCGGSRSQDITQLNHLTFQDNGVFGQGHIIEANGQCSELNIAGLVFLRNRCIGTHCVVLGARNTLTDIYLVNNQGNNETSLDSSIFFASAGSETIATEVTSLDNEIRSFYIYNSTMRMIDSRFDGNRKNHPFGTRDTSIGGGVIFTGHSSVSILHTIFERNYALNGGAIFTWSLNITISDCRFQENDALEGNGGAVYGHYNSSLDISSSLFSKNRGYYGAGVYSNYTMRVDLANVTFLENNCSRSCSVIVESGFVSIESSAFFRNSADVAGAALCTTASNLFLKTSTFVGNNARFGGACVFRYNSTINASNLVFESNRAWETHSGAILVALGRRMILEDSLFQNNYGHGSVGAIHSVGECETILRRVEFTNNTSGDYSGAVHIIDGNFTGSYLTFRRNRAVSNGGAIGFSEANIVSVSQSHFEDNHAGGAIMFTSTVAGFINQCTFVRNGGRASVGGAITSVMSNVNISSSIFHGNTASSGGSLAFIEHCKSTILNSTFENSIATVSGGAIVMSSTCSLVLSNSSFSGVNVIEISL